MNPTVCCRYCCMQHYKHHLMHFVFGNLGGAPQEQCGIHWHAHSLLLHQWEGGWLWGRMKKGLVPLIARESPLG